MNLNNWRAPQAAALTTDYSDWRSQLPPDSRQRIVNKILETLKTTIPFSRAELEKLEYIATKFEVKVFSVATNQSSYLRAIALKMLLITKELE